MNIEDNAMELTDDHLELVSAGDKSPPPPPKTCVQVCERVEGSSTVVCGPMICF